MNRVYVLSSRKTAALGALLFIIILGLLVTLVDWSLVSKTLARADVARLAAATASLILGYAVYALRWRYLIKGRPTLSAAFHNANIGSMVNALLPGRPGDAVRTLLLAGKCNLPTLEVASSVVVERWYEQIMRLAALGGALILGVGAGITGLTALGSLLYLTASYLIMIFLLQRRVWVLQKAPPLAARLPRVSEESARQWLSNLIDGLSGVSQPRRLLAALLWSTLSWTFFWGFHYLCLEALHPQLTINSSLAISLATLALVPPSATTAPGVYQVSMVIPLALLGYNRHMLTSYGLVMNVLEMLIVVLLGVFGMLSAGLPVNELVQRAKDAFAAEQSRLPPK
jgi:uncharacterized protein (TIRG00374 family)